MGEIVGIDLGSRTTKIVEMAGGEVRSSELFETEPDPLPRIRERLERLRPGRIVATGYGRHLVCENFPAGRVTEIKACARGVRELIPSARTILDVGGQDCKVIALDGNGAVADFIMNDRCAAGTGKFLEVMAQTFKLDLEDFIRTALGAAEAVALNSMCTVFAESEVVSLIASGVPRDKIALGVHAAIAGRLESMLLRAPLAAEIVFVGGGARNDCLHRLLENRLKRTIVRPERPQLVTALGAALLGEP
jgi:predicted CoA-substrate-specific enzyme activase